LSSIRRYECTCPSITPLLFTLLFCIPFLSLSKSCFPALISERSAPYLTLASISVLRFFFLLVFSLIFRNVWGRRGGTSLYNLNHSPPLPPFPLYVLLPHFRSVVSTLTAVCFKLSWGPLWPLGFSVFLDACYIARRLTIVPVTALCPVLFVDGCGKLPPLHTFVLVLDLPFFCNSLSSVLTL